MLDMLDIMDILDMLDMLEVRIFGDVHCASSDVRVTHLCLCVE